MTQEVGLGYVKAGEKVFLASGNWGNPLNRSDNVGISASDLPQIITNTPLLTRTSRNQKGKEILWDSLSSPKYLFMACFTELQTKPQGDTDSSPHFHTLLASPVGLIGVALADLKVIEPERWTELEYQWQGWEGRFQGESAHTCARETSSAGACSSKGGAQCIPPQGHAQA